MVCHVIPYQQQESLLQTLLHRRLLLFSSGLQEMIRVEYTIVLDVVLISKAFSTDGLIVIMYGRCTMVTAVLCSLSR
jgi:hypothetical protein